MLDLYLVIEKAQLGPRKKDGQRETLGYAMNGNFPQAHWQADNHFGQLNILYVILFYAKLGEN